MSSGPMEDIEFRLNGEPRQRPVAARQLLIHFLRDHLGLRGPKIGCDTGNCGACTIRYNGATVKSCMMLAVQADGADIDTVESLGDDGELDTLQSAFHQEHALQCGYCTPGMLMSAAALLEGDPDPSDDDIRRAIKGNICRCTGYVNIVKAIRAASEDKVRT